ncbi:MAG: ribonuclease J, partial [Eubacteriales bacterium]|nr:ribonuclease J [Eubacteriales bacterium]
MISNSKSSGEKKTDKNQINELKRRFSKKIERKNKTKNKNKPDREKEKKTAAWGGAKATAKANAGTGAKADAKAAAKNKNKGDARARLRKNDRPVNAQKERIKNAAQIKLPSIAGGSVRIIPLGGLEQIGMNITAFETEKSIVIVDCGMAFPDEEMLGVDLVIPDISYLKEHEEKIEGIFITHGHEDHIGALPYVLKSLNVPVFSTRLTRAIIENKLREHGLIESAKLNTVQFGDFVEAGDFKVEFIKTNHSIQDAAALAIHSPAGVILHTGDFKVDYTPVFGDTIDLQRFAELGKQGVAALLCDSTNALRQGFTMSERTVGHTFETIFSEHKENRIIVATFASNVDRVQQVINVAEKYGRKVVIDGRSMVNIIGIAAELGYIQVKDGTLIDISEIKNYPDDKIVLIVTGSQGEPMAVLSRMATGQHRKLSLSSN